MADAENRVGRAARFLHQNLLWLLVGSYVVAAMLPGPGLWLRSVDVASPAGGALRLSLPSMLLGLLLFNAGLGVRPDGLRRLAASPWVLAAGVLANLALPVACILGMAVSLKFWHNPQEAQEILIGLALIASMPVAGSSTAWVQNADGDLTLSIGLVVLSTCLSPLTTPLVLHAVGWMAHGEYASALHDLADGGVSSFLALFVLMPSLAAIAVRALAGGAHVERWRAHLKLLSSCVLLTLCYANAAVALPETVRAPDWDFLAAMLLIVAVMCVAGFAAGAAVGFSVRADRQQRASLMFGLGMTNNGTGLVVAAGALAHIPAVLLPIIFYNLVQHVVAGAVDRFWLGSGRLEPGCAT